MIGSFFWNRFFAGGPTQSGKTLACFIIPLMYHLFEIGETVICGVPSMDMAGDKWRQDIRPAIEASRYRDLMPTTGSGSKGGAVESIQFKHGPTLRFMSGGGNDKKRAGFTSRVLVITEVDGMDEAGAKSREADKITQLEGRLRAFGKRKRLYGECTFSTEQGRTWQEFTKGTASRLFLPCPHCKSHVHPTRDALQGWQGATTEHEAELQSSLFCPECGEAWSEDDRLAANRAAIVVHRGQEIAPNGVVTGDLPQTNTLGFRWDAVNNMFLTMGDVGAEEWKASRAENEENAEKEMRQFVWALPFIPSALDITPLEVDAIIARQRHGGKGIVPAVSQFVTVGVDVGKWLLHWVAVAWAPDGTPHVFDYGREEVPSAQMGEEQAILLALRSLRDQFKEGWACSGELRSPNVVYVDSGYKSGVVYAFCSESGRGYLPSDGQGDGQQYEHKYNEPKTTGAVVKHVGEGYNLSWLPEQKTFLMSVNADAWKDWTHNRLTTPLVDKDTSEQLPGAMTLFTAAQNDHISFAKHLTAEKRVEEFIPGKGTVRKWVCERRNNHWFDGLYNACAAGHYCGVRLVRQQMPNNPEPPAKPQQPKSDSTIDLLLSQRPGGWI